MVAAGRVGHAFGTRLPRTKHALHGGTDCIKIVVAELLVDLARRDPIPVARGRHQGDQGSDNDRGDGSDGTHFVDELQRKYQLRKWDLGRRCT